MEGQAAQNEAAQKEKAECVQLGVMTGASLPPETARDQVTVGGRIHKKEEKSVRR